MYKKWMFPLALSLAIQFGSASPAQGLALCLDPVGDLDGSGVTNVVDVQCELIAILWTLGGEAGAPPTCIAGPATHADVSCDNQTSVVDAVLLIKLALNDSIGELDPNGNGCPDACEPIVCGDDLCDATETCESCPGDCGPCGPVCGDSECTGDETCDSCPDDCGPCGPVCGDGVCNGDETYETCLDDCEAPAICGDGFCHPDEDGCACPEDCTECNAVCGDGICTAVAESCETCPADCDVCPSFCGDGTCDGNENCQTCQEDCTVCEPFCGDNFCNGEETFETCPGDCQAPAFCGDGGCDPDENCTTCEADCGPCPGVCDDGNCDPNEDCTSCEADCGICPGVCGNNDCEWDEECSECPQDCGPCAVCGDNSCNGVEDADTCPEDCVVCGDGACNGDETFDNCAADCVVCGDGFCNGDETFQNCSDDCEAPLVCGDGFCHPEEDGCACPQDCNECNAVCGDNICTAGAETCENCLADCGECPAVCGDNICEDDETCENCLADCGECPAVCGDDICEGTKGEDCLTCAADCPTCACGDGICQSPLESCAICADDCNACPDPTNSCCETSSFPGCVDEAIKDCVCEFDQTCCGLAWDDDCVALGKDSCSLDCPVEGTLDCCISHVDPGCVVPGENSGAATTHDVTVSFTGFTPNTVTIKAGDSIRWTSEAAFSQLSSLSPAEPFTSEQFGTFAATDSFEHTFTAVGTHSYENTVNSAVGTVIVEAAAETCSECVCALDDACCNALWDASCVGLGSTVCHGTCGCGEAPTQSCCEPGAGAGCADKTCMDCVCATDSLCCSSVWDVSCALSAVNECNTACSECASGTLCCQEHFSASCANVPCADCVCAADDLCCSTAWDTDCVTQAQACGSTCGCQAENGCVVTQESPGSTNSTCDACVCALDSSCCDDFWGDNCAGLAAAECNYACECGANGVTDQCGLMWDCANQCSAEDAACIAACGYQGTLEAQDKYDNLVFCAQEAECPWDSNLDVCAQQNCVLQYGACHATSPQDDCCGAHDTPSCPVPLCSDCVCQQNPNCCSLAWDAGCVELGQTTCKEPCVCVPDTPLEECAEVFECALDCPDTNVGTCGDICISKGVGEAGTLMGPFATCLTDKGCVALEGAIQLQACAEGLCSSSYNLCLAHQVPSSCCEGTAPCVDNTKCLQCIVDANPDCENNWNAGCNALAQNECNGLCNCTEVTPTLDCAQLDGCMNACESADQVCTGDCVASTPLDSYLEHAALKECIHSKGCALAETEEQYQQCIQTECAAESGACFGGGGPGPDPALPPLELQGILDLGIPGVGGKGIHLIANQNIPDLSNYGLGIANNGDGTDGVEYIFPSGGASAGEHLIVLRDIVDMSTYLTSTCFGNFAQVFDQNTAAITPNGDDAVELFDLSANTVIDVFGDVNVDGTGKEWEYKDSWAFKVSGNWIYGGVDCSDDSTTTFDSLCPYPFCSNGN